MTISKDRKRIDLPAAGDVYQGAKGEPHHAMFAGETIKNLGYTMNHRVPQVLISGCGGVEDDGITVGTWMFDTAPIGILAAERVLCGHGSSPAWWPHANNLTIGYAARAEKVFPALDGELVIVVTDKRWKVADRADVTPGDGLYVKESLAVQNNAYNMGAGVANGEYVGTKLVTWPRAVDSMVYVYILGFLINIGHWSVWVEPT